MQKKSKDRKNNPIIAALILFMIASLTTLALASADFLTQNTIVHQAKLSADKARHEVFADASSYTEYPAANWPAPNAKIESVYLAFDESGAWSGLVIVSNAKGYGGNISVMSGISIEDKIVGLKVISDKETPGLGKKVSTTSFTSRFLDKIPALPFTVLTNPNQNHIDALTGATISSRAMTSAVNTALFFAQDIYDQIQAEGGIE